MPITVDIKVGQLVEFPTGLYEFKEEKLNNVMLFVREDTRLELPVPEHKFVELHNRGKLRIIESLSGPDTNRFDNPEFGPDEAWTDEDDPKQAKLTREGRRCLAFQFYTQKWDETSDGPLGDVGLQRLINRWRPNAIQLGYELTEGEVPLFRVKPARLRFCVKNCGRPGVRPLRVFRSRRGKSSRRRFHEEVEKLLQSAVAFYWSDRAYDYNYAYAEFRTAVEKLNAGRDKPYRFPTRPEVLRRRIRQTICFDNWARKYSKNEAWTKFKGTKEHLKAQWPLELVVMDHTVFNTFMVFDQKEYLPLGRPGLTIAIDVATRMIVGYLVSFEPPSVYTIQTVLKRVNKNKSYIKTLYPEIKGTWDGWGRPNEVLVDQAWENKSPSFRHSLKDLGTDLILAPGETPQFKSIGERFFHTLETMLAHKLKGGVPYNPYIMRMVDLDPLKDAVLTLDDLDELIHRAIIVYQGEKHTGIDAVPGRVWRDKIAIRKRHIIKEVAALDRLVGRVTSATLTTSGIRFKNMSFHDQEITSGLLDDLVRYEAERTQSDRTYVSGRVKVVIKWNPADAGSIIVWNRGAKTPGYVTLPNRDAKFFDGLSFWHWDRIREFAEKRDLDYSSEAARWEARDELRRDWEKVLGRFQLRDTRDARRGLAFSQGTFDDDLPNDDIDIDPTTIMDDLAEASTNGMNAAQGVSDELYAITIDGDNEIAKGRTPSKRTVAKARATKARNKKEADELRDRKELSEPRSIVSPPTADELTPFEARAAPRGKEWGDAPIVDGSDVPLAQDDDDFRPLTGGKGWN